MLFPKQVDTSVRGRMADVVKAYQSDAFLSAISLALTIPDICGERLYPDDKVGPRYEKWFDEYVAPFYPDKRASCDAGEAGTPFGSSARVEAASRCYYFSGSDCHQLRCVYLHEGSNAPHIERGKTAYNVIQFRVFEGAGNCDHIGNLEESSDGEIFRQIDLDLRKFIESLDAGVEAFLHEHPEMNEDKGSESFFYRPILDFRNRNTAS